MLIYIRISISIVLNDLRLVEFVAYAGAEVGSGVGGDAAPAVAPGFIRL